MLTIVLVLSFQATGSVTEVNSWRINNIERTLEGVQKILAEMREDEAVQHEMRLTQIEAAVEDNTGDIEALTANVTWLVRLIIGTFIAGAIGLLYKWRSG